MPQPLHFRHNIDGVERFLFADICSRTDGPPLTVLSLLARAGFDPWAEAKRLAKLPEPEAVVSLASDINRVLSDRLTDGDGTDLARSLVSKLPGTAPKKPIDVSFAGNGFDGATTIAWMMGFFAMITVVGMAVLRGYV